MDTVQQQYKKEQQNSRRQESFVDMHCRENLRLVAVNGHCRWAEGVKGWQNSRVQGSKVIDC
jgi:hypothetical protein